MTSAIRPCKLAITLLYTRARSPRPFSSTLYGRRVRESGKTYFLKWTAGTMATGIKVTPKGPAVGTKEMRTLHVSKPPEDDKGKEKDKETQGQK